jgi:hypothetical protein
VTLGGPLQDSTRRKSSSPFRLVAFGASIVLAFWVGFVAYSPADAGRLVQRFGYYTMAFTTAWWILSVRPARLTLKWSRIRASVTAHRSAVMIILGLTLVAWVSLPFSYKVLYDEFVLQATAWNIHFFREFGTVIRAYEIEGVFRSVDAYVDKRPFFFPFVLSLIHDVSGFRELNSFILNALLLPVCLSLFYIILNRLRDKSASLAGLACFGASALLVQNANGSGMELMNLCMFLITVYVAIVYLQQPTSRALTALILSAILLAETRYESAAFVAPAALVILEGWRRRGAVLLPPAALLAPLLLIPCALQNTYLSGTPMLWELRPDVSARFELQYIPGNLYRAVLYWFDFSGMQLSSWWLSLAGLTALGIGVYFIARNCRNWRAASPLAVVTILFGAAVIGNFGLLMCYFWGQLDDPMVARLILPFNGLLGLAIGFAVHRVRTVSRWRISGILIVGALVTHLAFGLRSTTYSRDRNQLAMEIKWEQSWVASRVRGPRLIITNKSTLGWFIRSISSIPVQRAQKVASAVKFHLDARTFAEILVCQYYRPVSPDGGFQLDPRDELPSSYVLEPLVERRMGLRLLRISKVIDVQTKDLETRGAQSPTAAAKSRILEVP